ncbi:hypothetical protein ABZP36_005024 [Zizania latifolia]
MHNIVQFDISEMEGRKSGIHKLINYPVKPRQDLLDITGLHGALWGLILPSFFVIYIHLHMPPTNCSLLERGRTIWLRPKFMRDARQPDLFDFCSFGSRRIPHKDASASAACSAVPAEARSSTTPSRPAVVYGTASDGAGYWLNGYIRIRRGVGRDGACGIAKLDSYPI